MTGFLYGLYPDKSTAPKTNVVLALSLSLSLSQCSLTWFGTYCKFLYRLYPDESTSPTTKVVQAAYKNAT